MFVIKILWLTFLFICSISFSHIIKIDDIHKLINIDKIEFETEEQLVKKINDLTIKMIKNGYISSKIINEGSKLKYCQEESIKLIWLTIQ